MKISLGAEYPALAKELFSERERKVNLHWKRRRSTSEPLPHCQIVALAGKLYHHSMVMLENEPDEPTIWEHLIRISSKTQTTGQPEEWVTPYATRRPRE